MNNETTAPAAGDKTEETHVPAQEPGRRLPHFKLFSFHSIRTRGMVVSTGLVFLAVAIVFAYRSFYRMRIK
jgi:hypothetical protein